jgi:orotate phosphoribosyltransferase
MISSMLDASGALQILRESGAFLRGHFLLSSGLHSDAYVEKFRLLEHPELTERFAKVIAEHFRYSAIDLVVGPLTGGVLVAYEVAKALGKSIAFPERIEGRMEWRRGFSLYAGQRVLICEDVLTTGASVSEVMAAVTREGAIVAGIGCLIQRGKTGLTPEPFAVVELELETFSAENCPQCKRGVALEKRGSRT